VSSTLFKYDYDLPFLLVLYLSSLIFGYISDVNSFSDLFTQFVFESLKNWVGMTILLFFGRDQKIPQNVCLMLRRYLSKIVSFRINPMPYILTRVPGGDDFVRGEDNI